MKKLKIPDYHWTMSKGLTKEARKEMHTGDIWINAAVCVKCKDYVRSMNRHDFKYCKCGSIAVDGGSHYIRRLGKPEDMIQCIEMFEENSYVELNPVLHSEVSPKDA